MKIASQAETQRRKAKPAKMDAATTPRPYSCPKLSTMLRAASLLEVLVFEAEAVVLLLPVVVAAAPPLPPKPV